MLGDKWQSASQPESTVSCSSPGNRAVKGQLEANYQANGCAENLTLDSKVIGVTRFSQHWVILGHLTWIHSVLFYFSPRLPPALLSHKSTWTQLRSVCNRFLMGGWKEGRKALRDVWHAVVWVSITCSNSWIHETSERQDLKEGLLLKFSFPFFTCSPFNDSLKKWMMWHGFNRSDKIPANMSATCRRTVFLL